MKKISILAMSAAAVLSCAPKGDPQLGKDSLDKVVAAMTLEEKAHLVIGTGMAGSSGEAPVVGETRNLVPGAAGTTYPIPRLGIPAIVLADGPAGLRINPLREGDANTYYCTHFPIGTLLASTWNTELVEQVGQAIGNEVLEYGTDVLLAPALNIHRNPLCGRNFEYYSEDPVVSGKTAAAYVRGVQSNGVGTSIKHYALNNQETNRMKNDVRVSPRAVREIYLKGFEIAVKESQPWTVMSSYNFVNGVYTSESKDLQTTMLRDEWGFKGMVMTDWFGGADAAAQMWAGNDMLQPGRPGQFEDIVEGVRSGRLSEADLDRNVRRVLELIVKSPRFKGYEFSNKPDLKAHAAVTRQSAVEGMVLLENNGVLPLASEISRVAVFGTTSYDFIAGGTGSGNVNRAYTVSLLEGLRNAGYAIDAELEKTYTKYIKEETERLNPKSDDPMAMFMPKIRAGEFVPSAGLLDKMVRANDVAIITLGRNSGEFFDRKVADFTLTEQESGMIEAVCAAFHEAGKKVVVILNIGGVIETASWKNLPDAVLLAWQAGQEGGNSVADVLKGVANPSGKLTMTFPVRYEDHASSRNFPIDMAFGMFGKDKDAEPQRNVDYTEYEEGIYVGYRWFDKQGLEVSYPFGYGLSYTRFEWSEASVKPSRGETAVSVKVTNTGKIPGKDVVELYVAAPQGELDKPVKELKAYAKTRELQPGESQLVTLKVKNSELASYDESASAWVTDAGHYDFMLGSSSRDIRATLCAEIRGGSEKTNALSFDK
ncbi:MAG: beta-glucosidase [Candidatus Cryptobacteroides sp.]|nr:beta-glucosidase [Candidatus Cryptobacteroides sp.]MDY5570458.1 beta-glucosidase [Candidatus Cryptobacteroides sp.]